MNFLFGLAQGVFSALVLLALYWAVPNKIWALIPEEYLAYKRPMALSSAAILAMAITWNAVGTYGPRVALDRTAIPDAPERVEIEGGAEMVQNKGDIGKRFDEKIEDKP